MSAQVTPIQVPLTTGVARSFGHVRLSLAGLEFTGGFKNLKASIKREREIVYSNNPDPVAKTLGETKYAASVQLYYDWLMNFIQTIQINLGPGYSDQPFTGYFSYVGNNLVTYTDVLVNCTLDGIDWTDTQGNAALMREVELNPTQILIGGFNSNATPLVSPPQ